MDDAELERAYGQRIGWLENAWREQPSVSAVWGGWEAGDAKAIELHKAFMEFHRTGDAATLTAALRSPGAIESVNRESVARLSNLLDARRQPRRKGSPGGTLPRWNSARQVAAFLVERIREQWLRDHGGRRVPAHETEKFVAFVIEYVKTWKATELHQWLREKPLTGERVLALLREPKSKRL